MKAMGQHVIFGEHSLPRHGRKGKNLRFEKKESIGGGEMM
jgi:hypothetical protein